MKTNRPKKNSMEYDPVMEAILRDKNRPKSLRERGRKEKEEKVIRCQKRQRIFYAQIRGGR